MLFALQFYVVVISNYTKCFNKVKNIFKQEKIMLQLAFNPGLTFTGFRTSRPRC